MENGGLQIALPKCINCIKKEGQDPVGTLKIFINEGTQTDDTHDIILDLWADNEALRQKIVENRSTALREALTKAQRENERLLAKLYNLKNVSVKINKSVIQEKTDETVLRKKRKISQTDHEKRKESRPKKKRKIRKTIKENGEKPRKKNKDKPFGQANVFQYKCKVPGCESRFRRKRLMNHYVKRHNMDETEAEKLMPPRLVTTAKMEIVQCPRCAHTCFPVHLRRHIFQRYNYHFFQSICKVR